MPRASSIRVVLTCLLCRSGRVKTQVNCSVTDGTNSSDLYPCQCGPTTCTTGEICNTSATDQCQVTYSMSTTTEVLCSCSTPGGFAPSNGYSCDNGTQDYCDATEACIATVLFNLSDAHTPIVCQERVYSHTTCNLVAGETLQFLDRHHMGCLAGEAMTSFRMVSDGCAVSGEMSFKYSCEQGVGLTSSGHFTSCTPMQNLALEFLDRQNVACSAGEALGSISVTMDGCSGNEARYSYSCVQGVGYQGTGIASTSSVRFTPCYHGLGRTLEDLSNYNLECLAAEALVSFRFMSSGCAAGEFRYRYECTTVQAMLPYPPLYLADMNSSNCPTGHEPVGQAECSAGLTIDGVQYSWSGQTQCLADWPDGCFVHGSQLFYSTCNTSLLTRLDHYGVCRQVPTTTATSTKTVTSTYTSMTLVSTTTITRTATDTTPTMSSTLTTTGTTPTMSSTLTTTTFDLQAMTAQIEAQEAALYMDLQNNTRSVRTVPGGVIVAERMNTANAVDGMVAVTVPGTSASVRFPADLLESLGGDVLATVGVIYASDISASDGSGSGQVVRGITSVKVSAGAAPSDHFEVQALTEPIQLTLDAVWLPNFTCATLNEVDGIWNSDGVWDLGEENGQVVCATMHLSIFGSLLRGFISGFVCSSAPYLLSEKGLRTLVRGRWLRRFDAQATLGLTLVAILCLVCAFVLDCRWTRRGISGNDIFLVVAKDENDDDDENAGRLTEDGERMRIAEVPKSKMASCCLFSVFTVLFAYFGEIIYPIIEQVISNLGDACGLMLELKDAVAEICSGAEAPGDDGGDAGDDGGDAPGDDGGDAGDDGGDAGDDGGAAATGAGVAGVTETHPGDGSRGSRCALMSAAITRFFANQTASVLTKTVSTAMSISEDDVKVLLTRAKEVRELERGLDPETSERLKAKLSKGSRTLNDLADQVYHEMKKREAQSRSCFMLPVVFWMVFASKCPWCIVLRYSTFIPASMSVLLMMMEVYGNMFLAALFFEASGGAMAEDVNPMCLEEMDYYAEAGQMIAVGMISAFVAVIPGMVISCMHTRDFIECAGEDAAAWKEQLRLWRKRDVAIWLIGGSYNGFCMLFTFAFIANVTEVDSQEWFGAVAWSTLQSTCFIPLLMTVIAMASTILATTCRLGHDSMKKFLHELEELEEGLKHKMGKSPIKLRGYSKWASVTYKKRCKKETSDKADVKEAELAKHFEEKIDHAIVAKDPELSGIAFVKVDDEAESEKKNEEEETEKSEHDIEEQGAQAGRESEEHATHVHVITDSSSAKDIHSNGIGPPGSQHSVTLCSCSCLAGPGDVDAVEQSGQSTWSTWLFQAAKDAQDGENQHGVNGEPHASHAGEESRAARPPAQGSNVTPHGDDDHHFFV